jgi:uncharacterized protein YgbK (DUF1537 family)
MGCTFQICPKCLYRANNLDERLLDQWVADIVLGMTNHQRVVILVTHTTENANDNSNRLKQVLGEVTKRTLSLVEVDELLVEGGSTVSAVLNCMGVKKLVPISGICHWYYSDESGWLPASLPYHKAG